MTISHKAARRRCGSGSRYVQSVGEDDAAALVAERDANGPYRDVGDLARRAPLARRARGARRGRRLRRLRPRRRDLLWELGLATRPRSVPGHAGRGEAAHALARPHRRDARSSATSRAGSGCRPTTATRASRSAIHPLTLLRPHLPAGTLSSDDLHHSPHGSTVAYAGLAIARQRPSTANGIVFMLLEDEHGQVNLIVPKNVYEQHRAIVRNEPLLLAHGRYERVGENRNILVSSIETLSAARPPGRGARRRRARSRAPTISGTADGSAAVRQEGITARPGSPPRTPPPPRTRGASTPECRGVRRPGH